MGEAMPGTDTSTADLETSLAARAATYGAPMYGAYAPGYAPYGGFAPGAMAPYAGYPAAGYPAAGYPAATGYPPVAFAPNPAQLGAAAAQYHASLQSAIKMEESIITDRAAFLRSLREAEATEAQAAEKLQSDA